jgi:hypothetical protein
MFASSSPSPPPSVHYRSQNKSILTHLHLHLGMKQRKGKRKGKGKEAFLLLKKMNEEHTPLQPARPAHLVNIGFSISIFLIFC